MTKSQCRPSAALAADLADLADRLLARLPAVRMPAQAADLALVQAATAAVLAGLVEDPEVQAEVAHRRLP